MGGFERRLGAALAAVLLPAACTAFGSAEPKGVDAKEDASVVGDAIAPVGDAAPDVGDAAPDAIDEGCQASWFCDGFDRAEAGSPSWTRIGTKGATLVIAGESHEGTGALRIRIDPTPGEAHVGYLERDFASTSGAFAFRMKFFAKAQVTSGRLGGPRLIIGDSTSMSVFLNFGKTEVSLTQNDHGVCVSSDPPGTEPCVPAPEITKSPFDPSGWHKYVLTGQVVTPGPPYGKLQLTIDDVRYGEVNVGVPLAKTNNRAIRIGLSFADDSAEGTLWIDELTFWLEPL